MEKVMKSKPTNTVLLVAPDSSLEASPPGGKASGEPTDRRAHSRHECRLKSACKPAGRHQIGNHWKGWIENVSQEGLKLALNRRFEPGTLLAVEVDMSKEKLDQVFHNAISRFFLAKVVRVVSRPRRDGKWILGCLLVRKSNDDDLDGV
jgi:hypothetical protein